MTLRSLSRSSRSTTLVRPCFNHEVAGTFTSLGVPSFACTPDLFPDLMANAIQRRDIGQWAATQEIKIERSEKRD